MQHTLQPQPISALASAPNAAQLESGFVRGSGQWSGSDIMAPIVLTDGSIWFLGGDTWIGPPNADGSPSSLRMARNCLVSLRRGELTAWLGPNCTTALPAGTPETWLWPMSAVADNFGCLKIVSHRMRRTSGLWGFIIDGYDVSVLRFKDMAVSSSTPAPSTQGGAITWNGSATKHGGFVYVYGFLHVTPYGRQVVARTTISGINTRPWLYWTGESWSDDAAQIGWLDVRERPLCSLFVIEHNGAFLASSHVVDACSEGTILAWRSSSPTGPFEPLGSMATIPTPDGWMSYAGRIFATTKNGALVAMHSINGMPGAGTLPNVNQYGLHFGTSTLR